MHITRRIMVLFGVVLGFFAATSGPRLAPPWPSTPRSADALLFGLASACLLLAFTPRRGLRATGPLAPRRPGWWRADGIVPLVGIAILMRLAWIAGSIEIVDGLWDDLARALADTPTAMATRAAVLLGDALVVGVLAHVCAAAGRPRIFALLPALVPASVVGAVAEPSAAPLSMLLGLAGVLWWIRRPSSWGWTGLIIAAAVFAPVAALLVPACLAARARRSSSLVRLGGATIGAAAGVVLGADSHVRWSAGRADRPPWTVTGELVSIEWMEFAVTSAAVAVGTVLFVVGMVGRRSRRPAMMLAADEDPNAPASPREVRTAMGAFGIFAGMVWLIGLTPGVGAAAWAVLAVPVMPSALACAAIAFQATRASGSVSTDWSRQLSPGAVWRMMLCLTLFVGLVIDVPHVNFRRLRRQRPRRNRVAVDAILQQLDPEQWPRCVRCRQPLAPSGRDRCPECGTAARAEIHQPRSPFDGAEGLLVIGWGMTIVSTGAAILSTLIWVAHSAMQQQLGIGGFQFTFTWSDALPGLMVSGFALLSGLAVILLMRHSAARTWLWHRSPLRRRVLITLGFTYAGFTVLQSVFVLLLSW
ncbi:MAG: hypothetical protein AB8G96_13710 [Phycisphaerales bacterium]